MTQRWSMTWSREGTLAACPVCEDDVPTTELVAVVDSHPVRFHIHLAQPQRTPQAPPTRREDRDSSPG